MPSWTSSGVASSTSLNACFAAAIRVLPSMSLARMEPLTSRTRSTLGAAWPAGSSAAAAGREGEPGRQGGEQGAYALPPAVFF